jgi:hypothetical protein
MGESIACAIKDETAREVSELLTGQRSSEILIRLGFIYWHAIWERKIRSAALRHQAVPFDQILK